jgi:hypothetical protein
VETDFVIEVLFAAAARESGLELGPERAHHLLGLDGQEAFH